ncbi:similar to Saccharomyces cerevisiae YNL141W AAH1 Adenine deaminase (adenine aminohydrolase), converts adenine to hypoxanthine [Maudiozyma saulgeensis]|uniref:Adenine deaminase n=1 Tax=Maudiozyma saulgeensis TaxID=1789683 RepID=A0A1X7RBM1_9SACH|nr:similar to Saccharomyces cerevisiae YNL141W AAH1 Adenine deaminase (adenine aminohydrolase), converts adenine to hypoxanthine [Kazachstania saulgeensis]
MSVSEAFLKELPKCEHHLHLEGTLEPDLLFPLAARNNVTLPDNFPKTVEELNAKYSSFADLQDFLNYYYIGTNVLITEQDFFDLAWAYFTKVSSQGLVHAEVFYDPQSHTERGISLETVTNGFSRACKRAQEELGISSRLIMCLLRHIEPSACLDLVKTAAPLIKDGTIHGLGLDSAEKPFPPELFTECYSEAKSFNPNLQLTAHAGEEGPAQYVSNALDLLKVTRIDHGINSVQDTELLKRLARERILLTVCPLSNVKLQVVQAVKELPLQQLIDNDVPFSLNSDDPAYFGGYILDNYLQVARDFPHWDYSIWAKIATNAVQGSWIDDKRKQDILEQIATVVAKYTSM